MLIPEINGSLSSEVPEGAIFLPINRGRTLKNIESQIFQLLVGGRGPMGELPLQEKVEMHKKLSKDKELILATLALESL